MTLASGGAGESITAGTSTASARAADWIIAVYTTMDRRRAARLSGGPPLLSPAWRQFAGGFSVMAMVPVKISSLMMKAIEVR